ncbi:MAG: histidine phosphatase family protein [Patescibacteria group bacterium]
MRHGEKTGPTADEMTDFGREQVCASANAFLPKTGLDLAVHSDTRRTKESAEIVATVVPVLSGPKECRAMGFKGLYSKDLPYYDFADIEAELEEKYGSNRTAYHWLEVCPTMWAARRGLELFMLDTFEQIQRRQRQLGNGVVNIFGASHDPLCGMAAPRPREIPAIGTGGIMLYVVKMNNEGEPEIQQPVLLPCPLQH